MKKLFLVLFLSLFFISSANAWYVFGPSKTIHSHKTERQTAWPTTATTNSVDCSFYDNVLIKASASSVDLQDVGAGNGTWYVEVGYWDATLSRYLASGPTTVPASPNLVRASAQIVNGQLSVSFPTYNYSNVAVKVWKNSTVSTSSITVIAVPYTLFQGSFDYRR